MKAIKRRVRVTLYREGGVYVLTAVLGGVTTVERFEGRSEAWGRVAELKGVAL